MDLCSARGCACAVAALPCTGDPPTRTESRNHVGFVLQVLRVLHSVRAELHQANAGLQHGRCRRRLSAAAAAFKEAAHWDSRTPASPATPVLYCSITLLAFVHVISCGVWASRWLPVQKNRQGWLRRKRGRRAGQTGGVLRNEWRDIKIAWPCDQRRIKETDCIRKGGMRFAELRI